MDGKSLMGCRKWSMGRSWAAPAPRSPLGTRVPQRGDLLLEIGGDEKSRYTEAEAQIGHFVQVARDPGSPARPHRWGSQRIRTAGWCPPPAGPARQVIVADGAPLARLAHSRDDLGPAERFRGSAALHDVQARRLDGGEPTPTGRALATSTDRRSVIGRPNPRRESRVHGRTDSASSEPPSGFDP